MNLKDNFFIIDKEERTENTLLAKIKLNLSHEIFSAHFPGHPIVPGVCMLQILKEIISNSNNYQYYISQIKSLKFISPINPCENSIIILNCQIVNLDDNNLQINASFQDENQLLVFSKMKLSLSKKSK